jgi:hypothetical protein
MGFQIKDKEDKPIAINILDAEAAEFWGKVPDKKWYANPAKITEDMSKLERYRAESDNNWFDMIGYCIHSPQLRLPYYSGWKDVKNNLLIKYMTSSLLKGEEPNDPEYVKGMFEHLINDHLKPYMELINHWQQKGYTPHRVEEY